ncbi:MAG: DUF1318 domain-containing protein [Myxococcales bacterium]
MTSARLVLLLPALLAAAGCISAPEIVVVDRATALEQQAAGSFHDLEQKLAREAVKPQPVPLTPAQLESMGFKSRALVDQTELTDADQVDELLRQHCLGEATDGTLADTFESCVGAADRVQAQVLSERVNAARRQLWRWMRERKPEVSQDELRKAWRQAHLKGVVCGGWVQGDDGKWGEKKC